MRKIIGFLSLILIFIISIMVSFMVTDSKKPPITGKNNIQKANDEIMEKAKPKGNQANKEIENKEISRTENKELNELLKDAIDDLQVIDGNEEKKVEETTVEANDDSINIEEEVIIDDNVEKLILEDEAILLEEQYEIVVEKTEVNNFDEVVDASKYFSERYNDFSIGIKNAEIQFKDAYKFNENKLSDNNKRIEEFLKINYKLIREIESLNKDVSAYLDSGDNDYLRNDVYIKLINKTSPKLNALIEGLNSLELTEEVSLLEDLKVMDENSIKKTIISNAEVKWDGDYAMANKEYDKQINAYTSFINLIEGESKHSDMYKIANKALSKYGNDFDKVLQEFDLQYNEFIKFYNR